MKKSLLKKIIKEGLKKLFEVEPDPNIDPELNIGDRIEPEPEAEPTPEPDQPESTLPKEQPLQNISKQEAAQKIRETKGEMFTVTFIERTNGQKRVLNGRLGVKAYLVGGVLPYDPDEKELIPVKDNAIPGRAGYRMINIPGIINLKTGGVEYNVV
jgi:hypothetical protein